MLWSAADLNRTRIKFRVGNQKMYDLLCDIYRTALTTVADDGNEPRQSTASEERETWTVAQVATAAGLSERTVRLDAQQEHLKGTKAGRTWVFTRDAALDYIEGRKS
ncbi:hypothetical protein DEU37_1891 [Microbacterium sp. AG790]|nr:hypothetical protein DEU37_1891 [Microbacterium sp. AG790]